MKYDGNIHGSTVQSKRKPVAPLGQRSLHPQPSLRALAGALRAGLVEKVDRNGHDLLDHRLTDAGAEVAQIILAQNGLIEATSCR